MYGTGDNTCNQLGMIYERRSRHAKTEGLEKRQNAQRSSRRGTKDSKEDEAQQQAQEVDQIIEEDPEEEKWEGHQFNLIVGKNVKDIFCGSCHSFYIDKNNKVFSWGLNNHG